MSSPWSSISPTWTPARAFRFSAASASRIQRPAWSSAGGAGEGGQSAVPCGLDQPPVELLEPVLHDLGVTVELGAPRCVAESRELVGGPDDVGEEDGGEHALRPGGRRRCADERAQLREQLGRLAEPGQMFGSVELDERRVRDAVGFGARQLELHDRVIPTLKHEHRLVDCLEYVPRAQSVVDRGHVAARDSGCRAGTLQAPPGGGRVRDPGEPAVPVAPLAPVCGRRADEVPPGVELFVGQLALRAPVESPGHGVEQHELRHAIRTARRPRGTR